VLPDRFYSIETSKVTTNQERREVKTEKLGKAIEIYGRDKPREARNQNRKARENPKKRNVQTFCDVKSLIFYGNIW
jgi:hypothetical protein